MKKSIFFVLACFAISSVAIAQEKSVKNEVAVPRSEFHLKKESEIKANSTKVENENYISLKPADGKPAVFNSKELLESSVPEKKKNTIISIKTKLAEGDTEGVKILRWELWRLENAMVIDPKTQH